MSHLSPKLFPRLARYILRETWWLYLFGVAAFCLLLSIDLLTAWAQWFIQQLADYPLMERFKTIGTLVGLKLPWMLHLAMPISVVFAILLATGRLAKDSELKAAYTLGTPPLRLVTPLLLFGMLLSFVIVANNGYWEPLAKVREERLIQSFYSTRPPSETQRDVAYAVPSQAGQSLAEAKANDDLTIFYAGVMRSNPDNRDNAELLGILVRQPDGTRITANQGMWDSSQQTWQLNFATVIDGAGEVSQEDSLTLAFNYQEDIFTSLAETETLTLSALWRRYQLANTSGADSRKAAFEFHRRLADAFSAAVFALIAAAIGLGLKQRSVGFAWTIVLLVVFYFLWTLSGDLFERHVLSGALAAWLTAAIIGTIGLVIAYIRLR